jgi:hypothetical protein
MKPRIFIGSSTKGLEAAELAQIELRYDGEPELWTNGIFRSINVPIETLMGAVQSYDFALFVLLPEDPLNIRDSKTFSVRDNVIFELGLFMGRLGRDRNFFIFPKQNKKDDFHLPSDLGGIMPSAYDPDTTNPQASIGTALLEMKQALRRFQNSSESVIFDSKTDFRPFHLEHRREYDEFHDGKPTGPKGEGSFAFSDGGPLQIRRTNSAGRYEVELRHNGRNEPTISKTAHPERIFRIKFKAHTDKGGHELRFVLKDIRKDSWVDNKSVNISTQDWGDFEIYLRAPPSADLLLRIDDRGVTDVPSSVFMSSLLVAEVR